jgi:hypothetical protein
MAKAPKEQTTTTKLDPAAEAFRNSAYGAATNINNQPYSGYGGNRVASADPYSLSAAAGQAGMGQNFLGMQFGGNLQPYDQAGATGARALGGDQASIDKLMNPYQQNVIDAMGTQYDRMRAKAQLGSNAEATQAGAFGGARNSLVTGERMGALDRAQGSDIANLLSGGYQNMMNNAGMAAQLGLGAGGQRLQGQGLGLQAGQSAMDAYGRQFGMGDALRGYTQDQYNSNINQFNEQRDWGLRGLNVMNSAMGMPTGQTSSQPLYNNTGASFLGGATSGAGIGSAFGPIGTGIGAGVGGLLGIFG